MGAEEDGEIRQGSNQTTQIAISRDQFLAWKRQKVSSIISPSTDQEVIGTKNPSFEFSAAFSM